MYRQVVTTLCLVALVLCSTTSAFTFLAQENGLTEMTIRKYSPSAVDSNPLPGKVVSRIKGASTLNNEGFSWGVTCVAGSTYFALLTNNIEYYMYGIDLTTNQLVINGYSPDSSEMYVQALAYDSTIDALFGIAPNDIVPSWYDVVELDQSKGSIKKKIGSLKLGEYEYTGLYTYDQSTSSMFIVFKQFTNDSSTTQEGMMVINTQSGDVSDAIMFTGYHASDTNLWNIAFDPESKALYGTTSKYIGTERAFVRIDPTSGEITSINNSTEVCSGNGPVIQDGYFISPGHDSVSSSTIYYVNITTGHIDKKYSNSDALSLISFLSVYDDSSDQ
ncbi:hypothetical protein SAMD00019534_110980 [Acytostelium subglobosum LB1]|uniref:hypothetical protein n=1 Tax=Acytostelium subglobosum LB1 TaxID=1410327 RepID=UPI000644F01C|nr:hypothetical protein SAMD00019534_110980 [Acytostelium subglobosum LB1]GAM27922.1 hypothetical protein SAMD00019534_110980 [Acytostelium subglobosum LB1]|eukprot:XP_012749205.1 hypothetical protein SAMD00019534_110980 [Acytostelium subglobosum LB1]